MIDLLARLLAHEADLAESHGDVEQCIYLEGLRERAWAMNEREHTR